jgi:hypothetical protein
MLKLVEQSAFFIFGKPNKIFGSMESLASVANRLAIKNENANSSSR